MNKVFRDDDCPTTRRYSRTTGEAFHDAEYANPITCEAKTVAGQLANAICWVIAVAMLGALLLATWPQP